MQCFVACLCACGTQLAQRCMCNFLDVGQLMYYPRALSTLVSDSVRNIVFPELWIWLSHCHATNFKSKQGSQCTI